MFANLDLLSKVICLYFSFSFYCLCVVIFFSTILVNKDEYKACSDFYPRDTMLVRYLLSSRVTVCLSVRLSVCHKPALYQQNE